MRLRFSKTFIQGLIVVLYGARCPVSGFSESPTGLSAIRVPDGFVVEQAAPADLVSYPMCAAFDERGRLFVAESSGMNVNGEAMAKNPECRIRLLEDTDGDGVFDRASVFADKLSLPMGVQWYRGSLYVASAPDFVRLDDTDGDGVADRREVILTGWNVKNTASLHGPFLGPDGWMYLTHGRHGYKIQTKDGETLEGLAARIWRCKPDGTHLERVCGGGFDNPVELIFTPAGETIGTMTYFTDPKNGQRDALMHWVEGGVYSKPHECVSEFTRTGDFMPVMTKFARIAPAGLMRYRGDGFGAEYEGNLFSAQFNPHRVQRHILHRDRATFQTEDSDFLVSSDPDFHATDVLEDVDGSLLVLDTGGWYVDACPLSKISKPDFRGAIYRVRKAGAKPIADPRGHALKLESRSAEELANFLHDSRFAVRDQALELLVAKGADSISVLEKIQRRDKFADVRCNAVWGLYRIGGSRAEVAIRDALKDSDFQVRIAAARCVGLERDSKAIGQLSKIVKKDVPPARRQAATALGQIGHPSSAGALLVAAGSAEDRFVEHSVINALNSLNDMTSVQGLYFDLAKALNGRNSKIRKAALISLDQGSLPHSLRPEQVRPFLEEKDEDLRKTALWVVSHYPDWSKMVADFLQGRLSEPNLSASELTALRDVLVSFCTDAAVQNLMGDALGNRNLSMEEQLMLMDVMERSSLKDLPKAWIEAVGALLRAQDAQLQIRAVGLIRARGISDLDSKLESLASDPAQSADFRIVALGAISNRKSKAIEDNFDFLTAQIQSDAPATRRLSSAQVLGKTRLNDRRLLRLSQSSLPLADALTLPALLDAYRESQNTEVGTALVTALLQSPANVNALGGGRLEALLKNYPESVRFAAQPLFERIKKERESRERRLIELEPLLSGGDVGRGRQVFYGKKAGCASCHAIGNEGGNLGPDLTTIGAIRSGRDLLESLIFPSETFVPGYEPFRIETAKETLSGLIREQDSQAVVLATGADAQARIPRSSIRSIEPSTVSVMPEGLDTGLAQSELLDLLAFLQAQNDEQWLLSKPRQETRIPLFNGKDLTGFYSYLKDFGVSNDPDKVFTVKDGLLRVSGQHWGYLATKTEARNYRLVAEFKWGEQTWEPRKLNARDSGVLLHAVGEDKVWPKSIECQMIEGGTGDIIVIDGATLTVGGETKKEGRFDRPGRNPWKDEIGFRGPNEIENPHGEWNTIEVLCDEDKIKITVNGHVTNDGVKAEPKLGKILIQSEGAEVYFRRIDLYPLR